MYLRRIFNREGTKTAKVPWEHMSGACEAGRQPAWVKEANEVKNHSEAMVSIVEGLRGVGEGQGQFCQVVSTGLLFPPSE